ACGRRRLETGGAAWDKPPYRARRRNVTSRRSPFLVTRLPACGAGWPSFTLSGSQGRRLNALR
ncbi:MAG: hypothetical protein LBF83_07850, partial [Spirochaetaceae bacterium]|nr:hypothetical protein [Spirochaetaceae bacterium]